MKVAANLFYRMCLFLAFAFSGMIFIFSFTILDGTQLKRETALFRFLGMLAVPLAIFGISAAVCYVYRNFGTWLQKRGMAVLLFLILIFVQILFLVFVSHPMYTTDALKTQNEAAAMLVSQDGMLDMDSPYFQRYPNNHFIVVLFYYYFLALSRIGVTGFWIPAVVWNVICVDGAVLLAYASARRLKGCKVANLFLLLCVLCPTSYVWLTFVYTNTVSLPFVMGILYLFLLLQKPEFNVRQVGVCGLLGFCIVVGYKIRPTTALPVIALALFAIMKLMWRKRPENSGEIKIQLFKTALVVFVAILMTCAVKILLDRHVQKGEEDRSLPATHWVMMGLNEESGGGFNRADLEFSDQFPTKAQKQVANLREIKRRLLDMGVFGGARQVHRKMVRVWAQGSDTCFEKAMYASDFPALYERFMGKDSTWFRIYMQGFRGATFWFICISLLALLLRKNRKEMFVYALTLLGCISFFLLWEANTKYNICFIYLCLLLMADGVQMWETARWHAQRLRAQASGYTRRRPCMQSIFLGVGCAALLCLSASTIVISDQGSRVYQTELKGRGKWSRQMLRHSSRIQQTIQMDQDAKKYRWNELKLVFEPSRAKKAKGYYRVSVRSMPDGQLRYQAKLTPDDLDENGCCFLPVEMEQETPDTYYILELKRHGKKHAMYPCLQNSAYLDMYPYGALSVDGTLTDCDLCFCLYEKE